MTAFVPIPSRAAIALVERAGLEDAHALLADFAAAGLVKSYALVIEIIDAAGVKCTVRDATIPVELWQRMLDEGKVDQVWTGGTVRLSGSQLKGGLPAVNITGVSFAERALAKVLGRYTAEYPPALKDAKPSPPPAAAEDVQRAPEKSPEPLPAIPPGAVAVSVKEAMRALGLGRTKVNDLMNDGTLIRKKAGRRTLITVQSIEKLIAGTGH